MWSKARQLSVNPLSFVLLNQIKPSYFTHKLGTIFSHTLRYQELEHLEKHGHERHHISTTKAKVDYQKMLDNLPKEADFVHRGMAGHEEVQSIALEGKFGAGKYTKRPVSLDIAQFIHDPKSCLLLSTSPDPLTVKEYMIGFQLITAKGAIASMCLPAVYVRPQTVRHIDVESFEYYQKILDGAVEFGNRIRSENILDLAQGNNETTVVLGATKKDDWRPKLITDLHSLVLVEGAGRIWGGFTKADFVETTTIKNPYFRKRIMSIEIASTTTAEGDAFPKQFDRMNKRAQELGITKTGFRVLTLADASCMMSSPQYQEILGKYTTSGKTMVMQEVPQEIPVGSEELVEYARLMIEENPEKEESEILTAEKMDHKF
ncbi:hypothetical protein [Legionella sp. WA2022007384]